MRTPNFSSWSQFKCRFFIIRLWEYSTNCIYFSQQHKNTWSLIIIMARQIFLYVTSASDIGISSTLYCTEKYGICSEKIGQMENSHSCLNWQKFLKIIISILKIFQNYHLNLTSDWSFQHIPNKKWSSLLIHICPSLT